jgi:hypothetical protein
MSDTCGRLTARDESAGDALDAGGVADVTVASFWDAVG